MSKPISHFVTPMTGGGDRAQLIADRSIAEAIAQMKAPILPSESPFTKEVFDRIWLLDIPFIESAKVAVAFFLIEISRFLLGCPSDYFVYVPLIISAQLFEYEDLAVRRTVFAWQFRGASTHHLKAMASATAELNRLAMFLGEPEVYSMASISHSYTDVRNDSTFSIDVKSMQQQAMRRESDALISRLVLLRPSLTKEEFLQEMKGGTTQWMSPVTFEAYLAKSRDRSRLVSEFSNHYGKLGMRIQELIDHFRDSSLCISDDFVSMKGWADENNEGSWDEWVDAMKGASQLEIRHQALCMQCIGSIMIRAGCESFTGVDEAMSSLRRELRRLFCVRGLAWTSLKNVMNKLYPTVNIEYREGMTIETAIVLHVNTLRMEKDSHCPTTAKAMIAKTIELRTFCYGQSWMWHGLKVCAMFLSAYAVSRYSDIAEFAKCCWAPMTGKSLKLISDTIAFYDDVQKFPYWMWARALNSKYLSELEDHKHGPLLALCYYIIECSKNDEAMQMSKSIPLPRVDDTTRYLMKSMAENIMNRTC